MVPSPQRRETGEEGLPVYGPPTPAWLCPGALASILAEPGRADGVVAHACAMRTPVDPQSEIKGTIYGIEGIAPGFLRDRWPWVDLSTVGEDEARTSGGGDAEETGTWRTVDDDGRFPSLIALLGIILRCLVRTDRLLNIGCLSSLDFGHISSQLADVILIFFLTSRPK